MPLHSHYQLLKLNYYANMYIYSTQHCSKSPKNVVRLDLLTLAYRSFIVTNDYCYYYECSNHFEKFYKKKCMKNYEYMYDKHRSRHEKN